MAVDTFVARWFDAAVSMVRVRKHVQPQLRATSFALLFIGTFALLACGGGGGSDPKPAATATLSIQSALGTGAGTVSGSGMSCDVAGSFVSGTCIKDFSQNSDIALAAAAGAGSVFVGWGGSCASAGTGTCLFKLTGNSSVTANFSPLTFALGVASGGGSGTGLVTGSGVTCTVTAATQAGTCSLPFAPNTAVTLTSAATTGNVFAGWGGACTGTAATCLLTMSAPRNVTASYRAPTTLTVASGSGDGNGTVTGAGINCTVTANTQAGTCSQSFPDTSTVVLTAAAAGGHTFAGWGGACTGTTPTCSVATSVARNVTARFNAPIITFALTVASGNGSGNGTVTTTAAGGNLNCTVTANTAAGTCTANIVQGTEVVLTAAASPGAHVFAGWGGACTGVSATCTVTMSQARSVTAAFTAPASSFPLSVTSGGGTGTGTVTGGGLNCNVGPGTQTGTCAASLATGTVVVITATPTGGATFNGWTGACAGTAPCTVTMSQARAVTASFTAPTLFALVISRSGGTGSGTISGLGINCAINNLNASGTCSANQTAGSVITLTASPTSGGNTFGGWGGDCSGVTLTCNVTMSQARAVSASFVAPPTITIGAGAGNGIGSVAGNSGLLCNIALSDAASSYTPTASGNCSASFAPGSFVTLTASPAAGGQTFQGWSGGGCSGTGTCSITVSTSATITAKFNAPSLADVQTVFNTAGVGCNTCHGTVILTNTTNSYNNLVNINTVFRMPGSPYPLASAYPKRVLPYDAENSYIIHQMRKEAGAYPMPTSASVVPNNLIDIVKNWINGGALANQP